MGWPGGMSTICCTRLVLEISSFRLSLYISGGKAIIITRHNDLFSHYNLILRKLLKKWSKGSTSINNNIQRWPFEPAEEDRMFPEKSVIYFGLDVACLLQNAAMVAKKLLVDDKTTACFKQMCCYMLSSEEKNIIRWNILLSSKGLLSIFKFRAASNLLFFFYELLIGPQPTFLVGM